MFSGLQVKMWNTLIWMFDTNDDGGIYCLDSKFKCRQR